MTSSGCLGTSSVSVTSPVLTGFQSTDPLVRPIAAIFTSSVTSSPFDVFNVTVVRYSRGNVLSIVNGIRIGLSDNAERRHAESDKLDVRQMRGAPDRHSEHRHAFQPQLRGGLDRRRPFVPVAIRNQHDPSQVLDCFGRLRQRFIKVGSQTRARRELLQYDIHALPQRRPCTIVNQLADRLPARHIAVPPIEPVGTSRVSMLIELSQSTRIVGFSMGRNSSTHSG